MDHKSEAFALAGFMLTVNLMRLLSFKGVISPDEAMATVDDARRQLRALGVTNQAARADMLDRDLLDYEALFQEVDDRAAQELLATFSESLGRILDDDREAAHQADAMDAEVSEIWQPDGWGVDDAVVLESEGMASPEPAAAIEVAEYEESDAEPANER
jgi:hypothetical protein